MYTQDTRLESWTDLINFKGAIEEYSVFAVQLGSQIRERLHLVPQTAGTLPRAEEVPVRQAPTRAASGHEEPVQLLHSLLIHVFKQVSEVSLKEGRMREWREVAWGVTRQWPATNVQAVQLNSNLCDNTVDMCAALCTHTITCN